MCKFLSEVKVPEGYSSDIRRLVSMKDLKLKILKTHNCHVIVLLSNKVIDDNNVNQSDIDVENESYVRGNVSYIRNDQDENIIADESYIRNDHKEGIWINPSVRVIKSQVIHIPTKKRKRC